jgi:4-amino-4-deoxy-L-arabinose transferase-like glycosyltransferase
MTQAAELSTIAADAAPSRRECGALAIIVAVGAVLRRWRLGGESLWMDEGLTSWLVKMPWRQMIAEVRNWEQTPPGLHALLWGWTRIFGDSEVSLRMPSALLGMWAVFWIWRLARESYGAIPGLVAAAVLAVNAYHIHYSREARGYSLMVTAGLASAVYFLRCLRGEAKRSAQVGYVIATAVMLYAHLYGGFVAGAEFGVYWVVWAVARLRRRTWAGVSVRTWLTMVAAVAILYGPWVNVVLFEWTWVVTSGMFWLVEKGPKMIGRSLAEYWGWGGLGIAAWVAGAAALDGLWRRRRSAATWLMVAIAVLSLLAPVGISMIWTPVFWPRYGIMTLVAMIVLIAGAVSDWKWAAVTVALAAVGSVIATSRAPVKDDWRGVTRDLGRDVQPGDTIVNSFAFTHIVFEYYWRRTDVRRVEASDAQIGPLIADARRVWVVMHATRYQVGDLERENPDWRVAEKRVYHGITLVRLERRAASRNRAVNQEIAWRQKH